MIASKFLNDEGEEDEVFNDEWAKCADLKLQELNQLEREFLQAIVGLQNRLHNFINFHLDSSSLY